MRRRRGIGFRELLVSVFFVLASVGAQEQSCYEFNDGGVGLKLCLDETNLQYVGNVEYATVSGSLINIGASSLCNVTFDIYDIEYATTTEPPSLPRIPDSFDPSDIYTFKAVIPMDIDNHVTPYADVWDTFYVCREQNSEAKQADQDFYNKKDTQTGPNGSVDSSGDSSTGSSTGAAKSSMDFGDLITRDTMCFMPCYSDIISLNGGSSRNLDTCKSIEHMLAGNCHECDKSSYNIVYNQCFSYGCTPKQCQKETGDDTSAAPSRREGVVRTVVAAGLLGAYAAFAA